ncbi:ABC transporter substrate-binding protein [Roseofilum casamattae]|uniref:Sugar ABC transporter substrate-binding protein n=1 Tax=Roseofilum casamattae BLCC-M143 TaxID=3022442 RepID=A0ABT7BVH3_9CYAN|nr:sugar ABC transporter substrate-binding protein [Roseofilum casamattae BLCC-M143]
MFFHRRQSRSFLLLVAIAFSLSWLISCTAPAPEGSSGAKEIEFWTMQLQPKFTDYFTERIAQFEGENPGVTVRWVDVPWAAMESKILTAVAAQTAPDVVNLNPNFASTLAARNAWLSLGERVSSEDRDRYLSGIWQANTLEDTTFGLPWYLTARVTLYNTELLQQAGITEAPTTYAELAKVAQQVKEKTGKFAFFVTFVPEDSAEVLESLVQMGVTLVDDSGKAAFNSPEGKAAFEYWVDLYQKGWLPREVLTQGHRRAIELYQAGEIALLFSGPEFMNAIATNAPDISKVTSTSPQITGNTGKVNVAAMNVVIPQQTDVPEEALEFALFITNANNQLAFARAANVLPSTVDSLQEYQDLLKQSEEGTPVEQARLVSSQQLESAEVLIPAMKGLADLKKAIYDNLQAAMLGEKNVDRALADAAETWNSLN